MLLPPSHRATLISQEAAITPAMKGEVVALVMELVDSMYPNLF